MTGEINAMLMFLGGVVVAVIGALAVRPLRRAQARQSDRVGEATLSEATLKWAHNIREEFDAYKDRTEKRLAAMSARLENLEVENDLYRQHNALLINQLVDAGVNPAQRPGRSPAQQKAPKEPPAGGES